MFLKIYGMLEEDVRTLGAKIARRLIIKIASQIADAGYRSGHLKLTQGFTDGNDIELDRSLENYIEDPVMGIFENIVSYVRKREKMAFLLMLDSSYSMRGMKVILAAITAASIAQHFKRDYAVLAFNNSTSVLRSIDDTAGPEEILERLFAVELKGATNIRGVLRMGLEHIAGYERKIGLILTDGAWNQGGDPMGVAARFDKLSVIGFPPSKDEEIRLLARRGKGNFSFVVDADGIAAAVHRCLE